MFHHCRLALVLPNVMKCSIRGQLIDLITCVKFLVDRFRVTEFWHPKISIPIDLLRRPYNSVCTAVRHCDKYAVNMMWICMFMDTIPYSSRWNIHIMYHCDTSVKRVIAPLMWIYMGTPGLFVKPDYVHHIGWEVCHVHFHSIEVARFLFARWRGWVRWTCALRPTFLAPFASWSCRWSDL